MISTKQALAARQVIHSLVPREALGPLTLRSNGPAVRRLVAHAAALCAAATLVWVSAASWLVWPAMLLLGIVMTHLFAAQHECSHYTAFKSRPVNAAVAWICGAIILVPQVHFRYEHRDHHTFTNLHGQDPELIPMPATLAAYLWYLSGAPYWWGNAVGLVRRAGGTLSAEELRFIPSAERSKVVLESRILVLIYAAALAAITAGWQQPIHYWLLPLLLGQPVMRFIRMTEHVGCPNELDMTRNTRSTRVSMVWRWLAWNMNFHREHHLVPAAPFHALPELNRLIGERLPTCKGYRGAHREILTRLFARPGAAA